MTKKRLIFGRKSIATVAFLVVASLGVALFAWQPAADAWQQATTHQPRPHTALSYINTGNLPTYAPAGTQNRITFRLSNHEAVTTSYRYRVLLSTGAAATVIEEGILTIADGASADKTITFTLPQPSMDATIIVHLLDRSEHITFGTKS